MSDQKNKPGNVPETSQDMYLLDQHKLPSHCGNCKKAFEDLDDFLAKTTPLPNADSLLQEAGREQLGCFDLWRSCTCNSTLLMICQERRKGSQQGQIHRKAFDKLADRLEEVGFTVQEARKYLKQLLIL